MNDVVVEKGRVKSVPLGGGGVISATAGSVGASDTTGSLIVAVVNAVNQTAHISHWAVDYELDFRTSSSSTININGESGKRVKNWKEWFAKNTPPGTAVYVVGVSQNGSSQYAETSLIQHLNSNGYPNTTNLYQNVAHYFYPCMVVIDTATGEITFSDNQGNKSKHTPDALSGGNGQPLRENVTLRDVVTFLVDKKKGDELETGEINKVARTIGHAESSIKGWLEPDNIGHPELQSVQITLLKELINCKPALEKFGRQGLYEAAGLGRLYGDGTIQNMGQLAVALCLQKPGYSLPELESRAGMGAQYFHQQINLANGEDVVGEVVKAGREKEILWKVAHNLFPDPQQIENRLSIYNFAHEEEKPTLIDAENPCNFSTLVIRVLFDIYRNGGKVNSVFKSHTGDAYGWRIGRTPEDFDTITDVLSALNQYDDRLLGCYGSILKRVLQTAAEGMQVNQYTLNTLAAEAVNGRACSGQNTPV